MQRLERRIKRYIGRLVSIIQKSCGNVQSYVEIIWFRGIGSEYSVSADTQYLPNVTYQWGHIICADVSHRTHRLDDAFYPCPSMFYRISDFGLILIPWVPCPHLSLSCPDLGYDSDSLPVLWEAHGLLYLLAVAERTRSPHLPSGPTVSSHAHHQLQLEPHPR